MNISQTNVGKIAAAGIAKIGSSLRRTLFCRFGIHWRPLHQDERGVAGAWSCSDCGQATKAIEWPAPPADNLIKGVLI